MSRARSFASVSAAALALLLTACASEAPPAPPPPEVTIVTVRSQAVPNVIELPGRVQAFRTSEVRARVDGIVERRLFNEGSFVRAGTSLFRIDPRQLNATSNAARAQLAEGDLLQAEHMPDLRRLLACIVFYQAGVATVIAIAAIFTTQALGFTTVLVHSDKDWSHEPIEARPAGAGEAR